MRNKRQRIRRTLAGLRRAVTGRAVVVLTYPHAGQSMVEYGIVVALIAIVAFATVQLLGQSIHEVFQNILNKLQGLNLGG